MFVEGDLSICMFRTIAKFITMMNYMYIRPFLVGHFAFLWSKSLTFSDNRFYRPTAYRAEFHRTVSMASGHPTART